MIGSLGLTTLFFIAHWFGFRIVNILQPIKFLMEWLKKALNLMVPC